MTLRASTNLFLERSLKSAADFFKEALYTDEYSRSRGLLQALDSRVKLAALLMALLAACFARTVTLLAALYAVSVILAALSRIRIAFFIKRVWVFIPLFTLFMALPLLFTRGFEAFLLFVLRVATCVSFVVLVMITTRHSQILESLRIVGAPRIFIQVLDMTYRYIFFFIRAFEDAHLGLKSRLVHAIRGKRARRWIASRIGFLFQRSMRMSEEVYLAMVARGWTGEAKRYGK